MAFGGQLQWQVRDDQGRRKYLNREECRAVVRQADLVGGSTQALCHVLAVSGCRISEALALNIHQFDPVQMTLTFRTLKRRRVHYRTVPIPAPVGRMLSELGRAADGRFWLMHRTTAWRRIKHLMRSAGVEGPMATPKGFRHGFCMHAAERSVPPNLIQRWAGHASATTTASYLDAVGTEERAFAERMW